MNVASLAGLKPPSRESLKPSRESAGERTGAARNSTGAARESPTLTREVSKPVHKLSRAAGEDAEEDDAEVVARMSKAWRRLGMERESEPEVAKLEGAEGKRGDSF